MLDEQTIRIVTVKPLGGCSQPVEVTGTGGYLGSCGQQIADEGQADARAPAGHDDHTIDEFEIQDSFLSIQRPTQAMMKPPSTIWVVPVM